MPTLSIDQILQATGGTLLRGDKETPISSLALNPSVLVRLRPLHSLSR